MHRKKEEVILRILAQESLDLEMWLNRYEFLKFQSYFVDFSEARDLFVIIFQIPGSDCKFFNCGLILERPRGLNAKCPKLDFLRIIFLKEVRGPLEPRSTVDRSWTAAPSSPELRPPAASVSTGAGEGAGEGEWGARSAVGGSPGREWRCGRRASQRRGGGVECSGGSQGGFYRAGGGRRRVGRSNGGDEWLLRPLRLSLKGIKGGSDEGVEGGGGKGSATSEAQSGRRGEWRRGGVTAGVNRRGGEDETDKWAPCVSGWIERRHRERKA
jgi:hypothetical protein